MHRRYTETSPDPPFHNKHHRRQHSQRRTPRFRVAHHTSSGNSFSVIRSCHKSLCVPHTGHIWGRELGLDEAAGPHTQRLPGGTATRDVDTQLHDPIEAAG